MWQEELDYVARQWASMPPLKTPPKDLAVMFYVTPEGAQCQYFKEKKK